MFRKICALAAFSIGLTFQSVASEADDINAAIEHVNASILVARNAVLNEDGETALANLKAANGTIRANVGSVPNSVWNVRLQNSTFKPVDYQPLPDELTKKFHDDRMVEYLAKYETAIQSQKDAEEALAQKKYVQALKILLIMIKTLNDATDTVKDNPIFLYDNLKKLGDEAEKHATLIEQGFAKINSEAARVKAFHQARQEIIALYKQHRRRHNVALSIESEVKRLEEWHPILVDAVKRATLNPIPDWKQTSTFDSEPSVNTVNSFIADVSNSELPWDIADSIVQDTHNRAEIIYVNLPSPTPQDDADWQQHLNKVKEWEDMLSQRQARLDSFNLLGADWQNAVQALVDHIDSINLGTSTHMPTAVGQWAWFSSDVMSSTPVAWLFDYSFSTNPPSSLLPGSRLLQSDPSTRPASPLAGFESIAGSAETLRELVHSYAAECRLATASMNARDARDLQSDVSNVTAPFAVSILSGSEISTVRENLISLRLEALNYENDVKAALGDFQEMADLLEEVHAAATACRDFVNTHPTDLPATDVLSTVSVDLTRTSIPLQNVTLFDWDELHEMLQKYLDELELAVGAVASETSLLWSDAIQVENSLQADLDFNHELAGNFSAIQRLQEKMDAFRSGYLANGLPTYLYQSLRFIDGDMKSILLPAYQRDPGTFPALEESIRISLDYVRSLDGVSLGFFADLVEKTRDWTDQFIFSNYHYQGNVLWNVSRGGYSNPVGSGRLVFPENRDIAQMAADARWSTSNTRQRTEMEEAGYLTTDEITRGLPKVVAWLAGRGTAPGNHRLQIVSLESFGPVVGSEISSRATFLVFDENDEPAPDVLVVLNALPEAGLLSDVSVVTDEDGLASFVIPPLTIHTELPLTFSINGGIVLSLPIPWTDDDDGDELPTAWESRFGYDPRLDIEADADDDGDGLTTAEEFRLGTNPRRKDSDSDGFTDGDEVLAGTDPNNFRDIPGSDTVFPPIPRLGFDWRKIAEGPEESASRCSLVDLGGTWLAVWPVFDLEDRVTYNRTYTSDDLVNWTFRDKLELASLALCQHENETYGVGRYAIYRWVSNHWETVTSETPWNGGYDYRLTSWRGRVYAAFQNRYWDDEAGSYVIRGDIWSTEDFLTWTKDFENLDFVENRSRGALFVWRDSLVLGGGYDDTQSVSDTNSHYTDWWQLKEPDGMWQLADNFSQPPVRMTFIIPSHYSLVGDTMYFSGSVPRGNSQTWLTKDGLTWTRASGAPSGWPVVAGTGGLYILGTSLYHSGYAFPVDTPNPSPSPSVSRPSRLAAGSFHVLALDSSDRLWGWGTNRNGGLGEPTGDAIPRPKLLDPDHRWKCVAAAFNASLGIREEGTLWAWGYPDTYALGLPERNSPFARVQVGPDSDWKFVSTSGYHTLAIKEDGTLWAWGSNAYSALGYHNDYNQDDYSLTPVQVGTGTDWEYCRATRGCSVGIKSDGSAWLWGMGHYRTNTYTQTPGRITKFDFGSFTQFPRVLNVLQVGYPEACQGVLTEEGRFYLRATNQHGELGNGTTVENYGDHVDPVPFSAWTAVAQSGEGTIAAIRWNNTLWVWGKSPGSSINDPGILTPRQVGLDADWVEIIAGYGFFVARKTDGALWVFGYGSDYVTGNGEQEIQSLDPRAVDLFDTPNQAHGDSDGNGMPDAWEIEVAGRIGMKAMADDDGDGVPNRMEWIAKTDPQNPFSLLQMQMKRTPGGDLDLIWPAADDRTDLLYYSQDLKEWYLYEQVPEVFTGEDESQWNKETFDPSQTFFFRLTRGL